MFDMESIRALYSRHAVDYTPHFRVRINERGIKFADLRNAMQNGSIIEQNLQDMPNPSVLILGYTRNNKPLHIAIGMGDNVLVLITAYFPDSSRWLDNYKIKK